MCRYTVAAYLHQTDLLQSMNRLQYPRLSRNQLPFRRFSRNQLPFRRGLHQPLFTTWLLSRRKYRPANQPSSNSPYLGLQRPLDGVLIDMNLQGWYSSRNRRTIRYTNQASETTAISSWVHRRWPRVLQDGGGCSKYGQSARRSTASSEE
jgi:hypothetical protein